MATRKSTRKSTRTSARRKPAKKAAKKTAKKKTAKKVAKKKTAKKATKKKTAKKAAKKKTAKKVAKKKTAKKAAKKKTAKKKVAKKKTAKKAAKKKTAKKVAKKKTAKKATPKAAPARRAPAKKSPGRTSRATPAPKAAANEVAESSLVKLTLDLQSDRPGTVQRAITRLRSVVGPADITEFIDTLTRLEDEQSLQESVIEVCEGIEVPDAEDDEVTALLSRLHLKLERQPATVISGALTVLGRIGHRDSLYPIIRVLQDKYRRTSLSAWETEKFVRISAARALGRIGHRDAAVYLIEALNDHVGDVVIEVCDALRVVGDARCIPNLQEVLRKAARQELKDALVAAIDHMRQVGYRRG